MKTIVKLLFVLGVLAIAAGCQEERTKGTGHHEEKESHAGEIVFTRMQASLAGLQVETITPKDFRNVIKVSGQIGARQGDEQTLVARADGVVSFVKKSIAEGQSVGRGEVVATISTRGMQDGDPLQKASIGYEAALKEFRRAEELVADRLISVKEYEQIRARYETEKAVVEGLKSARSATGVSVASPIGGYVKNLRVKQGEYVTVGTPIAVVSGDKRLQLRADVPERYFRELPNVSGANFRTDYETIIHKLADLNGRLLSYGKSSENNSFYIPVTFEFDNVGDFVTGAFAEVYLLGIPRKNVLSVPVSALTEEQGIYYVYVRVSQEVFMKREVTAGQNDGVRVEILDGLKAGEMVVTKGVSEVKLASASTVIPESHHH